MRRECGVLDDAIIPNAARQLRTIWRILVAAEAVGLARAALESACEYAKVREQFGRGWLAELVEHVGSTAAPGLASKPVIDVLASLRSLSEAHSAVPVLEAGGRKHWPTDLNRGWRLWFLRPRPEDRTHHLYLIQYDDPHVWQLRAFRDALRGDESLCDRYGALKRLLAHEFYEDREAYTRVTMRFVE